MLEEQEISSRASGSLSYWIMRTRCDFNQHCQLLGHCTWFRLVLALPRNLVSLWAVFHNQDVWMSEIACWLKVPKMRQCGWGETSSVSSHKKFFHSFCTVFSLGKLCMLILGWSYYSVLAQQFPRWTSNTVFLSPLFFLFWPSCDFFRPDFMSSFALILFPGDGSARVRDKKRVPFENSSMTSCSRTEFVAVIQENSQTLAVIFSRIWTKNALNRFTVVLSIKNTSKIHLWFNFQNFILYIMLKIGNT